MTCNLVLRLAPEGPVDAIYCIYFNEFADLMKKVKKAEKSKKKGPLQRLTDAVISCLDGKLADRELVRLPDRQFDRNIRTHCLAFAENRANERNVPFEVSLPPEPLPEALPQQEEPVLMDEPELENLPLGPEMESLPQADLLERHLNDTMKNMDSRYPNGLKRAFHKPPPKSGFQKFDFLGNMVLVPNRNYCKPGFTPKKPVRPFTPCRCDDCRCPHQYVAALDIEDHFEHAYLDDEYEQKKRIFRDPPLDYNKRADRYIVRNRRLQVRERRLEFEQNQKSAIGDILRKYCHTHL